MLEYLILIVLRTLSIEHDIPSKGGHTTILPGRSMKFRAVTLIKAYNLPKTSVATSAAF